MRNLLAADEGELRCGKEVRAFTAAELADADKLAVLRAYLGKWAWEVGVFFDGVDAKSSDADLLSIAPAHPVFRLSP